MSRLQLLFGVMATKRFFKGDDAKALIDGWNEATKQKRAAL
jgi:hypothetical protein